MSPIIKKIKPTENPLPILEEYWASMPKEREVIFNIENIAAACRWSKEDTLKNIFASMWMKNIVDGAVIKAYYLSLFIKEESQQKQILRYMEKMAAESKQFALRFSDLLVLFWEQRVLEEEVIEKWYAHPNPKTPERLSQFLRDKSYPVIKWFSEQPKEEEALPLVDFE